MAKANLKLKDLLETAARLSREISERQRELDDTWRRFEGLAEELDIRVYGAIQYMIQQTHHSAELSVPREDIKRGFDFELINGQSLKRGSKSAKRFKQLIALGLTVTFGAHTMGPLGDLASPEPYMTVSLD